MSQEFGSRADMISAKIDEVSKNSIWREHCLKELAHCELNTNFSISNVKKMSVIPEKPNYVVPSTKINKGEMDAASTLLKSLCAVQDADLLPSERFELPVTSAQEVGWKFKPLVPRNAMFAKPRNSCDITLYADKYFEMCGTTPFSRNISQ
mmetsp:Transcript_37016/g.91478  ORF Transcript_37016/g.91478 Transcript_37016/m.91478 type:complete len:151 (-) Transcript_37016:336-788(-)|eukprot:CAMPEP_0197591438 /NCGR_PEP_ID=MMETSP1326-20131121/13260_1 /TAXON_ID=1155430 /ORGANISM="Genus nov. species nov., Strain RCC2288" /LENGTH=150 /DNA_ID=CAMNT_0043156893 /DNA_START=58 /DNA_END=510 /DNA_ORIENTATION=-